MSDVIAFCLVFLWILFAGKSFDGLKLIIALPAASIGNPSTTVFLFSRQLSGAASFRDSSLATRHGDRVLSIERGRVEEKTLESDEKRGPLTKALKVDSSFFFSLSERRRRRGFLPYSLSSLSPPPKTLNFFQN